jgi:hypothetical protein
MVQWYNSTMKHWVMAAIIIRIRDSKRLKRICMLAYKMLLLVIKATYLRKK